MQVFAELEHALCAITVLQAHRFSRIQVLRENIPDCL